ncbi:phospholipase-like protein [Tanacetum coccineum]
MDVHRLGCTETPLGCRMTFQKREEMGKSGETSGKHPQEKGKRFYNYDVVFDLEKGIRMQVGGRGMEIEEEEYEYFRVAHYLHTSRGIPLTTAWLFCSGVCVIVSFFGCCVNKMDLSDYEVPRVLVTCRIDKFQIQFSRKEFCLVTGLKFGVENWTDNNDEAEPIPFRCRVFSSSLDGQLIRGKHVEALINSKVFKKLDDNDVVSLCYVGILQLVLLGLEDRRPIPNWILRLANDRDGWDNYPWGSHVRPTLYKQLNDANDTQPTDEVDKKSYSLTGFLWAFNTWILESFQAATNDYYLRMLKPFLHVYTRVGPVSQANKEPIIADQHYGISDLSGFQSYQGVPSPFQTLANNSSFFNMATPSNLQDVSLLCITRRHQTTHCQISKHGADSKRWDALRSICSNPENVRSNVLMKLQEALDEEAILEEQIFKLDAVVLADRFTDLSVEINNLDGFGKITTNCYGKYALDAERGGHKK